jgi:hypothetical protein
MSDVSTVAVKPRDSTLTRRNLIIAKRIGIATSLYGPKVRPGQKAIAPSRRANYPAGFGILVPRAIVSGWQSL